MSSNQANINALQARTLIQEEFPNSFKDTWKHMQLQIEITQKEFVYQHVTKFFNTPSYQCQMYDECCFRMNHFDSGLQFSFAAEHDKNMELAEIQYQQEKVFLPKTVEHWNPAQLKSIEDGILICKHQEVTSEGSKYLYVLYIALVSSLDEFKLKSGLYNFSMFPWIRTTGGICIFVHVNGMLRDLYPMHINITKARRMVFGKAQGVCGCLSKASCFIPSTGNNVMNYSESGFRKYAMSREELCFSLEKEGDDFFTGVVNQVGNAEQVPTPMVFNEESNWPLWATPVEGNDSSVIKEHNRFCSMFRQLFREKGGMKVSELEQMKTKLFVMFFESEKCRGNTEVPISMTKEEPATDSLIGSKLVKNHNWHFLEIVDMKKVDRILKTKRIKESKFGDSSVYKYFMRDNEDMQIKTPYDMLLGYSKAVCPTLKGAIVRYAFPGRKVRGRLMPAVDGKYLGLCMMPRWIRDTLTSEEYTDVDMKAAGQSILRHIYKSTNATTPCPYDDYIKNREKILKIISFSFGVQRDLAKDLVTSLTYGGSLNSWIKTNQLVEPAEKTLEHSLMQDQIIPICDSFKEAHDVIARHLKFYFPKFNESIKDAKKKESKGKVVYASTIERSLVSTFVQDVERRIVERVMTRLEEEGLFDIPEEHTVSKYDYSNPKTVVGTYEYDGFRLHITNVRRLFGLEAGDELNEDLFEALKLHVEMITFNVSGINIGWDVKRTDEAIDLDKEEYLDALETTDQTFKPEDLSARYDGELQRNKLGEFNEAYFHELGRDMSKGYIAQREYFEVFNALIKHPCEYVTVHKDFSNNKWIYTSSDVGRFSNTYRSLSYFDYSKVIDGKSANPDKKPFIEKWMRDEYSRKCMMAGFVPFNGAFAPENKASDQDRRVFNTFFGYHPDILTDYYSEYLESDPTVVISKPELRKVLLKDWMDIGKELCEGSDDHFTYLKQLLAHIVQKPDQKTDVCVIFQSDQGCGKNLFLVEAFGKIFGQATVCSADIRHFFGEHSTGLLRKILCVLDESSSGDSAKIQGLIKESITGSEIAVNEKFKSPQTYTNHANIMCLSNKDFPMAIDMASGDRRFIAFLATMTMVNDKKKYSPKWWAKVAKSFKDPRFTAALYDELNEMDISDFKPTKRPNTIGYRNMVQRMAHPVTRFMAKYVELIHKPDIKKKCSWIAKYLHEKIESRPDGYDVKAEWSKQHTETQEELYLLFEKYTETTHDHSISKNQFNQALAKFFIDNGISIMHYDQYTGNYTFIPKSIFNLSVRKGFSEFTEEDIDELIVETPEEEEEEDDGFYSIFGKKKAEPEPATVEEQATFEEPTEAEDIFASDDEDDDEQEAQSVVIEPTNEEDIFASDDEDTYVAK